MRDSTWVWHMSSSHTTTRRIRNVRAGMSRGKTSPPTLLCITSWSPHCRAIVQYHLTSVSVGLAQITKLHQQWIRGSAKGAMSPECQELNALHSQSVDGARVKIPERLRKPPAAEGNFVLDVLADAAEAFRTRFTGRVASDLDPATTSPEDAEDVLAQLFKSKPKAISEYELFSMAVAFARKFSINLYELKPYIAHLDFGALAAHEKHVISTTLGLSLTEHRRMWNSLLTSDILSTRDIQQRQLNRPLSMQRLYSSREKSTATFFQYLRIAFEQFTRKLLILKVSLLCRGIPIHRRTSFLSDRRSVRSRNFHQRGDPLGRRPRSR